MSGQSFHTGSDKVRDAIERATRIVRSGQPLVLVGPPGVGKTAIARHLHASCGRSQLVEWDAQAAGVCVKPPPLTRRLAQLQLGLPPEEDDMHIVAALRRADKGTILIRHADNLSQYDRCTLTTVLKDALAPLSNWGGELAPIDVRMIVTAHNGPLGLQRRGVIDSTAAMMLGPWVVEIPPLRERPEDLQLLLDEALCDAGAAASLTTDARRFAMAHPWPGNVQELKEVMRRAFDESADGVVSEPTLRRTIKDWRSVNGVQRDGRRHAPRRRRGFSRAEVEAALSEEHGDVARAAKRVGVSTLHLYRVMRQYGM